MAFGMLAFARDMAIWSALITGAGWKKRAAMRRR
jgi:hypothetical protein